jgi:hypothetical protein
LALAKIAAPPAPVPKHWLMELFDDYFCLLKPYYFTKTMQISDFFLKMVRNYIHLVITVKGTKFTVRNEATCNVFLRAVLLVSQSK